MTTERRDDVGSKIFISITLGIVMLLITLFINSSWQLANEGKNKAFEVSERLTGIEAKFSSIQGDLSEIKELLKRRIPGG